MFLSSYFRIHIWYRFQFQKNWSEWHPVPSAWISACGRTRYSLLTKELGHDCLFRGASTKVPGCGKCSCFHQWCCCSHSFRSCSYDYVTWVEGFMCLCFVSIRKAHLVLLAQWFQSRASTWIYPRMIVDACIRKVWLRNGCTMLATWLTQSLVLINMDLQIKSNQQLSAMGCDRIKIFAGPECQWHMCWWWVGGFSYVWEPFT